MAGASLCIYEPIPLVFGCVKKKTPQAWLSVSNGGKKDSGKTGWLGRAAGRSRCDVTSVTRHPGGASIFTETCAVQRGSPIFQGVLKYVSNWLEPTNQYRFRIYVYI